VRFALPDLDDDTLKTIFSQIAGWLLTKYPFGLRRLAEPFVDGRHVALSSDFRVSDRARVASDTKGAECGGEGESK